MNADNRNLLVAMILSMAILFGWSLFSDNAVPTASEPSTEFVDGKQVVVDDNEDGPLRDNAPAALRDRAAVMADSPRVQIETPALSGSVNLTGARIDDLLLLRHHKNLAGETDIRLFSPSGAADSYFAEFGWTGQGDLPDADTRWTADGERLTPETPVTLAWTNATGARFLIELSVDQDYLFTARQRIENRGPEAIIARPYGLVARDGTGPDESTFNAHVGPIGVFNGEFKDVEYEDIVDEGGRVDNASNGGWLGFTDTYWLAAIIDTANAPVRTNFRSGGDRYQATMQGEPLAVGPRTAASSSFRLYAGAKEVEVLDRYEQQDGITLLERSVDWGWFRIIVKPIHAVLTWLFELSGNFGVAIILLVIIIRIILFPIANKQYESMAKLRRIQPKMKAMQERYKDDKPKLQQEMMKLYKEEKANPIGGCLPVLLQIPIFYALYKTLLLSIEVRHQPFVLWIKDLSAPDPLTPVNLFGFLPFDPPGFIAIGVLPILLGVTMYIQFKLNPAPMDEMQQKVFSILPWVFMVIMAPFAAGLQLYWMVNNILSIGQQWYLIRKFPPDPVPDAAKPAK